MQRWRERSTSKASSPAHGRSCQSVLISLGVPLTEPAQRSVSLRTTESAYGREIELSVSEMDVASFSLGSFDTIPTSFPFAIPLMPDVPQCVHTLHSSVMHVLNATLHPEDPTLPPISRELLVHTRRYTSHTHTVAISPEKHVMHHPVRVEAEVPKSTFIAGEPIPVYVTVPPPPRQLVLEGGLRLRNVKTELLRIVEVKGFDDLQRELQNSSQGPMERSTDEINDSPLGGPSSTAHHSAVEKPSEPFTAAYTTVMSRSGASCRFHTSNPIRLRFVLHQTSQSTSPPDRPRSLVEGDYDVPQCVSITQATLLHNVSFALNVHTSFVDIASRTETLYTISIPINIIPPPAPLPEVEEWIDAAYQKKHDRPPLRTVRQEDTEVSAPLYHEGEAGPSYTQHGAPPPFEDRDVPPPPFFPSEASTSTGLPTFQESEDEIYVPTNAEEHFATPVAETIIAGEGVIFGFSTSQQFDGHTDPLHRTSTPPPPVEQAVQDAELTEFVNLSQPHRVLGLIIEEQPPPPPPPLDDPSDPPPSIDSVFRSPTSSGSVQAHPSTGVRHHHALSQAGEVIDRGSSHVPAPPPYLTANDQEQVARPPPYVDFIPPHGNDRR